MLCIPYERIILQTNLSKEDIKDRLERVISPQDSFKDFMRNAFALFSPVYLFRGWVDDNSFKISPIGYDVWHIVTGKINNQTGNITIRLNYLILILYCLVLGILGICLLGVMIIPIVEIFIGNIRKGSLLFVELIFGVIFLAIYSIMMFTFCLPLSSLKVTLKSLLTAQ